MSQAQTPPNWVSPVLDDDANEPSAVLIRTLAGRIKLWSPAMERRYGFSPFDVVGRPAHQVLRTIFWHPIDEIQAALLKERSWSGGLLQRHADGRLMPTTEHWYLDGTGDSQETLVIELHADIVQAGSPIAAHIADVMAAVAHVLSQPLAAASTYAYIANRDAPPGLPNRHDARDAIAAAVGEFDRIRAAMRLFRELGDVLRGDH